MCTGFPCQCDGVERANPSYPSSNKAYYSDHFLHADPVVTLPTSPSYTRFSGDNATRSDKRRKTSATLETPESSGASIGPANDAIWSSHQLLAWSPQMSAWAAPMAVETTDRVQEYGDPLARPYLLARSVEDFQTFEGTSSWLQPTVQNYVDFLPDRPEGDVPAGRIPDCVLANYVSEVQAFFQRWKMNGNAAPPDLRDKVNPKGIRDEHGRMRLLACLFSKFSPMEYQSCLTKQFDAIARLKEHIKRCHLQPIFCPRCYVDFETVADRDLHLRRAVLCNNKELRVIQGYDPLNPEHQVAMTIRVNANRHVREQYNEVFHAFFPGARMPVNPWVDDELLKLVTEWEQFVRQDWPGIRDDLLGRLPPSVANSETWTRDFAARIVNAAKTGLIEEQAFGRARPARRFPVRHIPANHQHPPAFTGGVGGEDLQGTRAQATVAALHDTSPLPTVADAANNHDNSEWSKLLMDCYSFNADPDSITDLDTLFPGIQN